MPTISTEIIVVAISTLGSFTVAAFGFFFTKRYEIKAEWRGRKVSHYKELFDLLTDIGIDGTDEKATLLFSKNFNSIALIASQEVINALLDFYDYVKLPDVKKIPDRHDELLTKLYIEIRKELGLANKGDVNNFKFHLIGSRPKPR